jgi:hypothetical protein
MLRKQVGCKGVDLASSEKGDWLTEWMIRGLRVFTDNISNFIWNIWRWNAVVIDSGSMWKETVKGSFLDNSVFSLEWLTESYKQSRQADWDANSRHSKQEGYCFKVGFWGCDAFVRCQRTHRFNKCWLLWTKPIEYSSLEHSLRDTHISTFKQ